MRALRRWVSLRACCECRTSQLCRREYNIGLRLSHHQNPDVFGSHCYEVSFRARAPLWVMLYTPFHSDGQVAKVRAGDAVGDSASATDMRKRKSSWQRTSTVAMKKTQRCSRCVQRSYNTFQSVKTSMHPSLLLFYGWE